MRCPKLALVLAAAVAAGCGERSETVSGIQAPYPVTVTGAGARATVVTRRPGRIVALDLGSAELVRAVGGRLVGVPADAPRGSGPKAEEIVSIGGQVDAEGIVRLDPDLVVTRPGTDRLDVARAEAKTGAAVYVQPDESVEDVERAATDLGFLLGHPVRARRLVASIQRGAAAAEAKVAGRERVRVFVDTGFLITVSAHSLVADLVRRAGGASVVGATPPPGPFELCRVVRLRPDVILRVRSRSDPTAPRPRFRRCGRRTQQPAVRTVPAELVAHPGPRVAAAVRAVARALHPGAFQ